MNMKIIDENGEDEEKKEVQWGGEEWVHEEGSCLFSTRGVRGGAAGTGGRLLGTPGQRFKKAGGGV